MADSIWISTDGNLNAAGSYSPSGVPGAAGNIAFDGSSNVDVLSNLTALTAVDLTRVWTQPAYAGNIGADGNPLTTAIKQFIVQGSGSVWYSQQAHASLQSVVVDSPNQQDAFALIVADSLASNSFYFVNGGVRIADSQILGPTFVGSRNANNFPFVTIGSGCIIADYYQRSGVVNSKTSTGFGSGRFLLDGGTFTVDASCTGVMTNRIDIAGGTFVYNGSGALGGVYVSSGTLDLSQDSRAKTLTGLILLPGSKYLSNNNVTISSGVDLRGPVPVFF